jgi:GxxExxY protein
MDADSRMHDKRDERTYDIVGAAMEVHKELGGGFLEAVYQEALERELASRQISFEAQPTVQIYYKGQPLNKNYQPDFICSGKVLLEIKALSRLSGTEEAQMINYLKATGLEVGLLINFGARSLEYKRFVHTKRSADDANERR